MAQVVKNLPAMWETPGSIPGSGRSPGEGKGYSLQHSCLENPREQGSLVGYSPWGRKDLDTTEQLRTAQTGNHSQMHQQKGRHFLFPVN